MDGPTRPRRVLVIALLVAITFVSLDLRGFGPLDRVQRGVREALQPLRSAVTAVTDPVASAWDRLFNYDDLEDENRELRQRLAAAEGRALADGIDAATLARLREADVTFLIDYPLVIARVERGASGNFSPFRVELSRGADHGFAPRMAVIDGAGMVGVLEQVDASTSIVVLLTDPGVRIGVRLSESGLTALTEGIGADGEVGLILTGSIDDVIDGEIVTTAGPDDGSLYPQGVPIGVVRLTGTGENRTARVELAGNIDELEFVNVVIYTAPDPVDVILGPDNPVVSTAPPSGPSTTAPPGTSSTTTTTTSAPAPVGTGEG